MGYLLFYGIGLVAVLLHLKFSKIEISTKRCLHVFLMYLLLFGGFGGVFGFIGHQFAGAQVAKQIGWPTGNPFQQEVGFANLGLGLLGIMCFWFRKEFWLATIVMGSVFLWGAAYGHWVEYIYYGNTHPGNWGWVFILDVIIPLVNWTLLFFYLRAKPKGWSF